MLFGTSGKMVKKTKLTDADKQRLKVLRNKLSEKIYRLKTEIVYQKLSKTVEMVGHCFRVNHHVHYFGSKLQ